MHTWTFPKCSKGHLPGPPLGSPVSPLKVEVGALECTLCLASLNGLRTALRVSWKEILKISTFKALNILLRCRISLFFFEIQNMNFTVYLLYSSKENNFKKVPGWKSITVAGSAGKDSLLGFVVVVYFLKRRSVTLQPQLLLQQKQGNRLVRSLQLPRKVLKKKHNTKQNTTTHFSHHLVSHKSCGCSAISLAPGSSPQPP